MKALTANRLSDGEVVFWKDGRWIERFADAQLWAGDDPRRSRPKGRARLSPSWSSTPI